MKAVDFHTAIDNLVSGKWEAATTLDWAKKNTKIKIKIKKLKKRKMLQLTHRDDSVTFWSVTSANIFEDKYMEA